MRSPSGGKRSFVLPTGALELLHQPLATSVRLCIRHSDDAQLLTGSNCLIVEQVLRPFHLIHLLAQLGHVGFVRDTLRLDATDAVLEFLHPGLCPPARGLLLSQSLTKMPGVPECLLVGPLALVLVKQTLELGNLRHCLLIFILCIFGAMHPFVCLLDAYTQGDSILVAMVRAAVFTGRRRSLAGCHHGSVTMPAWIRSFRRSRM